MSYSYIKSVFPNFENSNKVYDETLYNNISSLNTDTLPKFESVNQVTPNYKVPQKDTFEGIESHLLEKIGNKEGISNTYSDYSEVPFLKPENQNNLAYYNLPLKINEQNRHVRDLANVLNTQNIPVVQNKIIENFEQNDSKSSEQKVKCVDQDCDQYIKHVLECSKCKAIAIKQLGVESDRFRNEEMMEVASYIIFGLFILLLIDSLKSREK